MLCGIGRNVLAWEHTDALAGETAMIERGAKVLAHGVNPALEIRARPQLAAISWASRIALAKSPCNEPEASARVSQPRRSPTSRSTRTALAKITCCSLGSIAVKRTVTFERAFQPKCNLATQAANSAPRSRLELFAKRLLKVKTHLDSFFHHVLPMLCFVTRRYA